MRPVIALVAIVLGGCYQPSIASCQYACANTTCPSGLTCNSANMCVVNAGDSCTTHDGGDDGGMPNDVNLGEAGCMWSYNPSNADPCSFTGPVGDWMVTTGATFDTDQPGASGDFPPAQSIHQITEPGGQIVVVVFVHQLSVKTGATIAVHGSRPLIILADTSASIDGAIDGSASSSACNSRGTSGAGQQGDTSVGTAGAGGGGGGSYGIISLFSTPAGARGGDGGSNGGDPGAKGGDEGLALSDDTLVPMIPGCPGGKGGTGIGAVPGGAGGLGGAAIQVSTRAMLIVAGQIRANGSGGKGTPSTTPGGGGGGSGGAILLEGTTVVLQSSSFLCANGGGGGASVSTAAGETGHCSSAQARGVIDGAGDGGDGESTSFDAIIGQTANAQGGGGGGGGVGIIRANGTLTNSGGSSPHVVF